MGNYSTFQSRLCQSYAIRLLLIFAVSLAYTLILFFHEAALYAGDSESYMWVAQYLSGQRDYYSYYYRTIGYPLLMVVSGVTYFHTLWGIFIVQALMAVSIPIIIYKTVKLFYPTAAFWTAICAILSLIPYAYMKAVLCEQAFIFLLLLTICWAALYVTKRSRRYFYLLVVTLAFLTAIRPSAEYLFVAFFLPFLFLYPGNYWRYIYGVVFIIFMVHFMYLPNYLGAKKGETCFSAYGLVIFYPVYLSSAIGQIEGEIPFRKENGPATAMLMNVVNDYLDKKEKPEWSNWFMAGTNDPSYSYFIERYANDLEGLKKSFYSDPTHSYRALLEYFVDRSLSNPKEINELFFRVSMERLRMAPYFGLQYVLRNVKSYFWYWGGDYRNAIQRSERWAEARMDIPLCGSGLSDHRNNLTPAMREQILYKSQSGAINSLFRLITNRVKLDFWRKVIFLVMVVTAPFLIYIKQTRTFSIICFLVIGYSAVIICLFHVPLARYIMQTFLIEIMLAVMGMTAMIQEGTLFLRQKILS